MIRMICGICLWLLALCLPLLASAQTVQEIQRAAQQGDAQAQFRLGAMYQHGQTPGVPLDKAQAAQWFRKAAEQGNGNAQYALAQMYLYGQGVEQNEAQAMKWLRQYDADGKFTRILEGALQGDAQAQFALAVMFENGHGVRPTRVEAEKWYRKAAEQGHADAQFKLALLYQLGGHDLQRNDAEAEKWYCKAAAQGHERASFALRLSYSGANAKIGSETRALLLDALCIGDTGFMTTRFFNAMQRVLDQGDTQAGVEIAQMFDSGKEISHDSEQAARWYQEMARQDNTDATYMMGLRHLPKKYPAGPGAPANQQALAQLRAAAEKGQADAQYTLGQAYHNGWSVARDDSAAVRWNRLTAAQGHWGARLIEAHARAMRQGDAQSQYEYAQMLRGGPDEETRRVWSTHWLLNWDNALPWYRKAAEQGHVDAQYWLGKMYQMGRFKADSMNGSGPERNPAEARKWLLKAAEQGHAEAQFTIASSRLYYMEYAEAERWMRKAAMQGHAEAQYQLGQMYKNGQGVALDYSEAEQWTRKAAAQGHAQAQADLGALYQDAGAPPPNTASLAQWCRQAAKKDYEQAHFFELTHCATRQADSRAQYRLSGIYGSGIGVKRNETESGKWLRMAANQGYAPAQYQLGSTIRDGAEALKWFDKAARQGYVAAQLALGRIYQGAYDGFSGAALDEIKAVAWYRKAAEQGNTEAQWRLGLMYKDDENVRDYAQALNFFHMVARHKERQAWLELAEMYENGLGVEQNYVEAMRWYRKAADKEYGDGYAPFKIGEMYENGWGVSRNDAQALKWYRQAAQSANTDAQYRLGAMYAEGRGVAQNRAEAARWLREAAERGHEQARDALRAMQ